MQVVRDIINIMGKPAEEIIHDKVGLGRALMSFVFGTGPEFNRELIHIGVWHELRGSAATNLWLIYCLKKFGMQWVDEKLMPSYDEKTNLMATVLGAKDVA